MGELRVLPIILLIMMFFSVFSPATKLSELIGIVENAVQKNEDVFLGEFSQQNVVAVPNEAFKVSFSICPIVEASGTVIRFILPADLVKLVKGDLLWTGDVAKGETVNVKLLFATEGDVDAYVRADVEALQSGKNYRSSYYLHVVTRNVELRFAGEDNPGATRARGLNGELPASQEPEYPQAFVNVQATTSAAGTIRIMGGFEYVNEDGGYSPARHVLVWVRDQDVGEDAWVASQWTDSIGRFDITCNNIDVDGTGRDPYIQVRAEGRWDWIGKNDLGQTYVWNLPKCGDNVEDGFVYNYPYYHPTTTNEVLQAGDAVYTEMQWIFDQVDWRRSKVTVKWPSGDWPHTDGDTIYLPYKSIRNWNHVSVHHEQGHCVMWALYGEWPSGPGPDPHYVFNESSYGFAMLEGWAEFMSCAVDNEKWNLYDRYNGHGGNIENNDWFNCIDSGDLDGAIIEGSVASIFWDIFDPVDIAGDKDYMDWGFDAIFGIIRNYKPTSIQFFLNFWKIIYPDLETSVGPLSTIYWHYGIDEDHYSPWGSIIINSGDYCTTSGSVTLTLSGEDWGSGVRYMRFSENNGSTWGPWLTYWSTYLYNITDGADGLKRIDVQYADYWNQTSSAGTIYDQIVLDTTPPTGSMVIGAGDPTYTTTTLVTLYLNYSDGPAGSGVYQVRYYNFNESWSAWEDPSATKAWTLPPGDGYKSVWYEIKDFAGLTSAATIIYDGIVLDTIAPTGSIVIGLGNPTYTTSQSVTLYLNYSDDTSGVYLVMYSNEDGFWHADTPTATKAWTLTAGDGNKTVYYQVRDAAGLISQYSDSIILDVTPPTGSIVINSDAVATTTTSVTLSLTYSDSPTSVYQVRYSNDGTWDTEPWETPVTTKAWNLTAGDGNKTVYYQVKDIVGLLSSTFTDTIILDTVAPTGSIIINNENPITTSVAVTLYLTYSDAVSGVYLVRYSNDGTWDTEPWETPVTTKAWNLTAGDGNKTVYYQIRDNAGLISLTYSDSIVLQSVSVCTWCWEGDTLVNCVAAADVDGDGQIEIVTGGYYDDGTRDVAQLVVWNSSSLAPEQLTTWYWFGNTTINSVAVGDVDGDGGVEIVTGGYYFDGSRDVAQLVVWNGSSLAVEGIRTWYWVNNTVINSVALGDVDGDGQEEIVTGGYYNDDSRDVAQLVIWNGTDLSVDRLTSWYWIGNTVINSVAIGNIDSDPAMEVEIVTGGYYNDGAKNIAQLVVWAGSDLSVDRQTSWCWASNTEVNSVALGDVDGDGQVEIVTGGYYNDGTRDNAQLVVWTSSTLAVDRLTTWYWIGNTVINSVALGDVDGDGQVEIVTGGYFNDGARDVAQMVAWSGSTLAVENIRSWYWVSDTVINSVCLSDINGDLSANIVTGGAYHVGERWNAQLTVWGMTPPV